MDITARVEAEERLRAAEVRSRALLEHASDYAFIVDRDGVVIDASLAVEARSGYRLDDFLGRRFEVFVHPDDVPAARAAFAQACARPGPHPGGEYLVRTIHGTYRWTEVSFNNLLDVPDVVGVVLNSHDVHRRRLAHDALRASEEQYRTIVETASDGIWIVDRAGATTFANARMGEILGCCLDALQDAPILGFVDASCVAAAQRLFASDRPWRPRRATLSLLRPDAAKVPVEVSSSPVLGGAGEVTGALLMVADVSERKRWEDDLQWRARHDELTGLPNRSQAMTWLHELLDNGCPDDLALLFVDLDEFKAVNDSLGHAVGDEVLRAVASLIGAVLAPNERLARFSGDEFVVLVEGAGGEAGARDTATRIRSALATPFRHQSRELYVGATIGIALAGEGGATPAELVSNADAAMYDVKARNKGLVGVYDASLRAAADQRIQLEGELRGAVERHEFVVYYQPLVELYSGAVTGYEALVRWRHPRLGLVMPGAFIGLAEQTGVIVDVGRAVLTEACLVAALWPQPLCLSVNLSARQLADPHLVSDVAATLELSGMDATRLCLEITESVVMENPDRAGVVLRDLKDLGVALAIDDFGTGYSSLGYLKHLPVDSIKLDRSFVAGIADDPDDHAIVRAVVQMADALGLGVTAEGVETQAQLDRLKALGCRLAQGFLWSPAVPCSELTRP